MSDIPQDQPVGQSRIGDVERSRAVDALSRHYTDGRLDQHEFNERLSQAMEAKTSADLSRVLGDLPRLDATVAPTVPYAPPMQVAPKYCSSCGNPLVVTAAICPRCGTRQPSKSRAIAVVLAVFFSFWSFLYTYRRARWKFWLGLGLDGFTFALSLGTRVGAISAVWLATSFAVWLWSVIDRSVTPLGPR